MEPLRMPWTENIREAEFPAVDIKETDNELTVNAELPGMNPDDIDVSIQDNHMILQGEKKFEEERGEGEYRCIERRYGSFYRVVPLPAEVDKENVKAKFKNGVLEVSVPKTTEAKSKKVQIES
jgi:HSP20 family protein